MKQFAFVFSTKHGDTPTPFVVKKRENDPGSHLCLLFMDTEGYGETHLYRCMRDITRFFPDYHGEIVLKQKDFWKHDWNFEILWDIYGKN